MTYEKASSDLVRFESEDVVTSSIDDCSFPQWDAVYCDGVTQSVSKDQFRR